MESSSPPRTTVVRRQVERLGRALVTRRSARRVRSLVASTPRRRIADLTGAARATLVGSVADVAGDGPAVETWRGGGHGVSTVSGRTTRPFVLDDDTGRISVRIPPDGDVVVGSFERGRGRASLERGDSVAVTGQVVRGPPRTVGDVSDANGPDERWALTGPTFALLAPP